MDDDEVRALIQMANHAHAEKNWLRLSSACNRLVRLRGSDRDWAGWALAAEHLSDVNLAAPRYRKALRINPNNRTARVGLARVTKHHLYVQMVHPPFNEPEEREMSIQQWHMSGDRDRDTGVWARPESGEDLADLTPEERDYAGYDAPELGVPEDSL